MQREPGQCKIILLLIIYIYIFMCFIYMFIYTYICLYIYICMFIYMFLYIYMFVCYICLYIWIYGYTFGAHWFVHKVAGLETSWNHRMGSMRAGMQIVHVWVPHQLAQKNLAWESACPRMSLRELRSKTHVCCNLSFKIFKLTQWINVSNNRPPWIFGEILPKFVNLQYLQSSEGYILMPKWSAVEKK